MTTRKAPMTAPLDALIQAEQARELDRAIGAAALDGDSERLEQLEHESARRQQATERHRLADEERARRAQADDEAERATLLATLTQQLGELEQQHRNDLALLDTTPQSEAYAVVERAYVSGRQAYSLAHDLQGVTGDRRFHRAYRVPDALTLHGGAAGELFMRSIAGRPPRLATPWQRDVERLRALTPHVERIGNGG